MRDFDFVGKSRTFFAFSLGVLAIALMIALIFGIQAISRSKGGSILTYAYARYRPGLSVCGRTGFG
jgi:hypothetical protein